MSLFILKGRHNYYNVISLIFMVIKCRDLTINCFFGFFYFERQTDGHLTYKKKTLSVCHAKQAKNELHNNLYFDRKGENQITDN